MLDSSWCNAIDQNVDLVFDKAVQLRRHLHRYPELSGHEQQTTLFLYQLLDDVGFETRMGPDGRGVVAEWRSDASEKTLVALRADIDALKIHDEKEVEYRSQHDGIMHACGHDAHTATVFAALLALHQSAETIPDNVSVRAIFQPAEETCRGAREMIDVGALEDVKAILATHMDPARQVGTIGVRSGVLTANCDDLTIRVVGRGGHAARPHETSDPIVAASHLISTIYQVIPRSIDSQDAVVVTIGQIMAGENPNVIPEEVTLRGTVRTLSRRVRQQTMEHLERLADGFSRSFDAKVTVEMGHGCDSVRNAPMLVGCVRDAANTVLGTDGVREIPRASMGSEDFAFYLAHVPGAMFRLGCSPSAEGSSGLHTPTFDVDEEAIRYGAKILARAAVASALQIART